MPSDGRYDFTRCQPTGSLSFGAVRDGELITRPWTVTANAPANVQSLLDNGNVDPSSLARYSDANIMHGGKVLANVTEWEPVLEIDTSEFRPGGQRQKWDVDMGFKITLSFTETIVSDAALFGAVLAALQLGQSPEITFSVVYRARTAVSV